MAVNKQPANAQNKLNKLTLELEEYPMEELARIKKELIKKGRPVFDFGTGDPKIPTWEPIREACVNAIPEISQYPRTDAPYVRYFFYHQ